MTHEIPPPPPPHIEKKRRTSSRNKTFQKNVSQKKRRGFCNKKSEKQGHRQHSKEFLMGLSQTHQT